MPRPQRHPDRGQPADLSDASRGERIQRVLADAGVASRRDCERLIEEGRVEVNGSIVWRLPAWVDPERDRIMIDGRPMPKIERKIYVLLNKPVRTLSAAEDEPGADRRTVVDLVDHPAGAKLFPVGRLDYDSVGLLLLTNDGDLANRLTHPRYGVPKTYRVVVKGQLTEEDARELEEGIYLAERKDGRTVGAARTSRVELTIVHTDRESTTLDLVLREGRNRQVRRMLASVGRPVKKLERIGMGPLTLKGVPRGGWRELTKREIDQLRRASASPEAAAKSAERNAKKRNAKKAGKKTTKKAGPRRGGRNTDRRRTR